jgi:C1A family cysteine protease
MFSCYRFQSRIYLDVTKIRERSAKRHQKLISASTPTAPTVLTAPSFPIPLSYSLRPYVSKIFDQGDLGSCTANAFAGAHCLLQALAGTRPTDIVAPSRLYFYYYERYIENNNSSSGLTDSGADEVDGLSLAQKSGVCIESLWPYIISKYNVRPPSTCDADAQRHKIRSWGQVTVKTGGNNNAMAVKTVLVEKKCPVLIAMNVYQNFESSATAATGMIMMPSGALLGGHEMYIVGYDDTRHLFTIVNSWGTTWGDRGFCYLPYNYMNSFDILELTYFFLN